MPCLPISVSPPLSVLATALVPAGLALPALLDDFHAREILHVTFGSALANFGAEIKAALVRHTEVYDTNLQKHSHKHLDLLKAGISKVTFIPRPSSLHMINPRSPIFIYQINCSSLVPRNNYPA